MKTKILLAMVFAALLGSSSLDAATTKSGYWFSLSKENVSKAAGYFAEHDIAAGQKMMDAKLIYELKGGLDVVIVETGGFLGLSLIKFRLRGSPVEFWTVSEAIIP